VSARVPSTASIATFERRRAHANRLPPVVAVSFAWMALLAVVAVLGPVLPIPDPNTSDYDAGARLAPFVSLAHPLGTDGVARDLLSRLISGAGVSLAVGLGSVAIAGVAGIAIGATAGYFGGILDRVLSWLTDILLAFPAIIAMVAITAFIGPSLGTLIVGLGIVSAPQVARVARTASKGYAQRDFIQAAKAMGAPGLRILWRDILPNIMPTVISFAVTLIAIAIVAEGAMSFLGLGVPPPQASWGSMMNDGYGDLKKAPFIVVLPAVVMVVTLLAINFIADWVSRRFDSRSSQV